MESDASWFNVMESDAIWSNLMQETCEPNQEPGNLDRLTGNRSEPEPIGIGTGLNRNWPDIRKSSREIQKELKRNSEGVQKELSKSSEGIQKEFLKVQKELRRRSQTFPDAPRRSQTHPDAPTAMMKSRRLLQSQGANEHQRAPTSADGCQQGANER